MTVYDAAVKNLPLGHDVYGDITNCFQDWRAAACDAIFSAPEPSDDNANTEWWIAILGNMAWAATVMFPPAFTVVEAAVVAGASAATKAVSFLGAAAGSGVITKVREYRGKIKADGKDYIRHLVLSQIPRLQSAYVVIVDAWAKDDLIDYLIMFAEKEKEKHGGSGAVTEEEFFRYYKSAKGSEERYRMVWEWLVFPNSLTKFDRGQEGLEDFFSRELKETFEQFEQQWHAYTIEATRNYSGLGRYMKINLFVPHLTLSGFADPSEHRVTEPPSYTGRKQCCLRHSILSAKIGSCSRLDIITSSNDGDFPWQST